MGSPPRVMTFPVTMTCNSKCRSCGIWRLPDTSKQHSGEVLLAKLINDPFLRQHVESVNLSGGEPYVHPGITDLMTRMLGSYDRLREICVNTDGHLKSNIKDSLEAVLPSCREKGVAFRIYISLDGIGQAHDRHRRHPGAFSLADEALRYLAALKANWPQTLRVSASFTITDRNVDQMIPVFEYVRSMGIRVDYNLAARPEVFIGGAGLERSFQVNNAQFEQVRDAVQHICAYPENLNFSKRFYGTMLETLQSGKRKRACFFPEKGFVLMPDGKVYICGTYLDFYFGNLLEDDFSALWNGLERHDRKSNLLAGKCESCFSNSYEDWDLASGALV